MTPFCGILTGSRVYGTPRTESKDGEKPSDIDIVLLVTEEVLYLVKESHRQMYGDDREAIEGSDAPDGSSHSSASLYFGGMNLILETRQDAFAAWQFGTQILLQNKPVSRTEAISMFRSCRTQLGLRPDHREEQKNAWVEAAREAL